MSPQMPHTGNRRKRYVVASCHVERPLDDAAWRAFSRLQERRPGGLPVAALLRPPDGEAGEDETRWLERAREAAARGPLGLHTHWSGPGHARPTAGDPAARVRAEIAWLRGRGLEPRYFAGGGWYSDLAVRRTVAEAGLVDCTATAFRPPYLPDGASHLRLPAPAVVDGALVLPATHSLGMAVRSALGPLPPYVHVYFHDTDLVDGRRRAALAAALRVLARRGRAAGLDEVSAAYGR